MGTRQCAAHGFVDKGYAEKAFSLATECQYEAYCHCEAAANNIKEIIA